MQTMPAARIGNELIPIIRFDVHTTKFETGLFEGEATMARNDLSGKNGDMVMVTKDGEVQTFDDHRRIAFGDIIASPAPGLKFRTMVSITVPIETYIYDISILKHVKVE